MTKSISRSDLLHITQYFDFRLLKHKKIFLTGGTGFFGKWILQTLDFANKELEVNCNIVVLSRNSKNLLGEFPQFKANPYIHFIHGDIKYFEFPEGEFDYIIHAAADPSDSLIIEKPIEMYDSITNGTKRVLDFAVKVKPKNFLLVSSGAVYGRQPPELQCIDENYQGAPLLKDRKASYAEGKRVAEFFCSFYEKEFGISFSIARCFSFLGAYLPLDINYVAGNFIRNILENRNLLIKGDGTPVRSYLYMADLVIWLFSILITSVKNKIYNVGSNEEISVLGLANKLRAISESNSQIEILKRYDEGKLPERYVPSIKLAEDELGLKVKIELDEAIHKTFRFFKDAK